VEIIITSWAYKFLFKKFKNFRSVRNFALATVMGATRAMGR
jgi:hypothetical protein